MLALAPGLASAGKGGSVPNFVLKNLEGKNVALADLKTKGPVLIDFWATWCKPCLREMPHIEALHKEYGPRGLQVVAISVDDTRSEVKAKSYVKTHGFTFNVLFDPNQRALRDLQGVTCPYLVLVSPEGERLYTHSGYRDGDEKELARVVAETMAALSPEGKNSQERDSKDADADADADAVPAGENGDAGASQEGG